VIELRTNNQAFAGFTAIGFFNPNYVATHRTFLAKVSVRPDVCQPECDGWPCMVQPVPLMWNSDSPTMQWNPATPHLIAIGPWDWWSWDRWRICRFSDSHRANDLAGSTCGPDRVCRFALSMLLCFCRQSIADQFVGFISARPFGYGRFKFSTTIVRRFCRLWTSHCFQKTTLAQGCSEIF